MPLRRSVANPQRSRDTRIQGIFRKAYTLSFQQPGIRIGVVIQHDDQTWVYRSDEPLEGCDIHLDPTLPCVSSFGPSAFRTESEALQQVQQWHVSDSQVPRMTQYGQKRELDAPPLDHSAFSGEQSYQCSSFRPATPSHQDTAVSRDRIIDGAQMITVDKAIALQQYTTDSTANTASEQPLASACTSPRTSTDLAKLLCSASTESDPSLLTSQLSTGHLQDRATMPFSGPDQATPESTMNSNLQAISPSPIPDSSPLRKSASQRNRLRDHEERRRLKRRLNKRSVGSICSS